MTFRESFTELLRRRIHERTEQLMRDLEADLGIPPGSLALHAKRMARYCSECGRPYEDEDEEETPEPDDTTPTETPSKETTP